MGFTSKCSNAIFLGNSGSHAILKVFLACLSQPALIVSDPVQISQIRDGKSPLSQPALIVSDLVQISQIRDGKSTLSQPFSVTNLGSPDRV